MQKRGFLQTSLISNGVPGQIRTAGFPLRRRILYPTELREHLKTILIIVLTIKI